MKKEQIKVGGVYRARISGNFVDVRVDDIRTTRAGYGREGTHYHVTNLKTNRKCVFRSAAKFRGPAASERKPKETPTVPVAAQTPATGTVATELKPSEVEQRPDPTPTGNAVAGDDCARTDIAPIATNPSPTNPCPQCGMPDSNGTLCARCQREDKPLSPPTPHFGYGNSPTPRIGLGAGLSQAAAAQAPHVQVQALAGTGKTTTLVEGMRLIKGQTPAIKPSEQQQAVWDSMQLGKHDSIRFAAFGKAIATELQDRLTAFGLDKRGCEASTFHSMGCKTLNKAFGRQDASSAAWVVKDICAEIMGGDFRDLRKEPLKLRTINAVNDLVGLCKQNLAETDTDSLDALTSHYDVELDGVRAEVYALVPKVLDRCKNPQGKITFDDMVWLPVIHGLPLQKADMLLVDEVQDLNRMQQALAMKAGYRIVMVGDEHQAIFGFAGADAESMRRMQAQLNAVALPLTVTRRCGRAIVAEANRYVPAFQAHPDNADGEIRQANCADFRKDSKTLRPGETDYKALVRDGDFVLCRMNAPLVQQCFRFISAGRKANIQGRDVGRGLVTLVEKLCPPTQSASTADLIGRLSDWIAAETAKEGAKRYPSENRLQALHDRHDCLVCFCEGSLTAADVVAKIGSIFTDDRVSPGVKLSSIHRAKGLEADNVFILQTPYGFPEEKMKPWERQQNLNLQYVAITRAKKVLTYVT
jgi:DNA helicase-2/ATP-dependent DNA helicase PcrA